MRLFVTKPAHHIISEAMVIPREMPLSEAFTEKNVSKYIENYPTGRYKIQNILIGHNSVLVEIEDLNVNVILTKIFYEVQFVVIL